MNNLRTDALVASYLARLNAAALMLPADRRDELIEQIRGHVTEALGDAEDADEVAVRNLLDRLGPPEEIVRASMGEAAGGSAVVPAPQGIGMEIAAVILLLIGGIVVPIVGWFVGLALLLASPHWTVRDKLLGALVWPFGLASVFVGILFVPFAVSETTVCVESEDGMVCETSTSGGPLWLLIPLGFVVAQVAVAVHLIVAARRSADQAVPALAIAKPTRQRLGTGVAAIAIGVPLAVVLVLLTITGFILVMWLLFRPA